jgi:DNA end-binding protein Ku
MATRPLWTGSIAFGLVNVPVELHSGVRNHRPRFHLLCSEGKSRVKYERICQKSGNEVSWDELSKGYEYEKGKYVVLTKDDFKAAALEKTRTIDVLDFVKRDEVDHRFYETPYYLLPGKGGDRTYGLLREAIRETGRMGIAKFILREAQHLAAITVEEDALILTVLRFADEIIDMSGVRFPSAKEVRRNELALATSLIDGLSAEWDPEKYRDDYRENLMRVINAKIKGRKPALTESDEPADANVIDLMERLRRSIEGKAKETRGKSKPRNPAKGRSRKRAPSRKKKGGGAKRRVA